MADATDRPVIFLAFANDRDDTVAYLRNLPNETRRLRNVLEQSGLCEVAASLNNLGATLSELGRREEALAAGEEAVQHRRTLAEARPDVFLPDLAGSLHNLGIMLSELGLREEALAAAEEAVQHYSTVTERYPQLFLQRLESACESLRARLIALEQPPDENSTLQAATELLHRLGDTDTPPPRLMSNSDN